MTNNLITLTIPNDDHVALRAFGKALEEMARERQPHQITSELNFKVNIDTTDATAAIERLNNTVAKHTEPEVDTTAQQVESLVGTEERFDETATFAEIAEAASTTDNSGTPWDERIHSVSKALNSDGTWRLRRKPKDMDEAEWAAFVEGIKACYEVDDSPVQQDVEQPFDTEQQPVNLDHVSMDDTPEPPVTPPGDDFHTDACVVTEQTVAGIPPIPVPPPIVEPPVQVTDEQWDFPKLMKFLTERHGRITVEQVNQLLAVDGLAALTDLNAHPDKIGPFVARVKAHLGE